MSPTATRKSTSSSKNKAAPAKKSPPAKKASAKSAKKPVTKAATPLRSAPAAKKSVARKAAAKPPRSSAAKKPAAQKLVAKKPAVKAVKKVAASKVVRKSSEAPSAAGTRRGGRPTQTATTVKPSTVTAKPSSAAKKPVAKANPRRVSPAVAKRHFLEALESKQQRVAQGPGYPPPNPYTGRTDAPFEGTHPVDEAAVPVASSTPSPEATYGAALVHARGNQGMRKQR